MTDENKRKNIALMLERAERALHAADVLVEAGDNADAVSRAYYGAFYHARALLLSEGIEPRRHGSVDRLVQRDFVRAGKLDPDIGGDLSRLQSARLSADYSAEHVFTEKATRETVAMAKRFAAAVRECLESGGWLEP